MSGTLFVVATPIGNLEDLTPRASQTLASVDLVAAEDTRHTQRLLFTIGAKPALIALHDHNEERAVHGIIESLKDGKDVALVSDAGTPLVSDPGFRLVRAAHENDITIVPIPGASAVTAALSAAGLPTDRFCFEGFAPSKRAARRDWLQALAGEERTMVIYESVHRIAACLADMVDIFGADRPAFIGRELTKMYEECVQESLGELQRRIDDGDIRSKGEFVIVVSGAAAEVAATIDSDRLLIELSSCLSAKDAARIAANVTGEKKNALYERILELKADSSS
ncbi:MAG: 16S rRNA (cytidine(1402)-2'-O)-methyltransferase [Gammaproteobacteria bacterium]|jgi:16S rRNA (cytidine1402-2'-O)-methyltransferase|nr:16S rRNA (cytidine(1402)-2'-O)-methyltransferase [Gammaproteobacteria bacterium]MDH3811810.1 16S rRNA (cytidine(1402)-2'-O)-methyltransferase [Gammaproteobacteria bacterium]